MSSDVVIVLIGFVFLILGLVGCFAPLVPGPPMSFLALLILHFTNSISFSTNFLLMWAVIVILITLLEYFIPIWGSKKFGGSTAGSWGASIGMFLGLLFFPPMGLIIGTVLGALLGEMYVAKADLPVAMKAAMGALIGFVFGAAIKLTVCLIMTFYFVKEIITVKWY
jgi:uncharacterized protein YqgC (DUF456 family)